MKRPVPGLPGLSLRRCYWILVILALCAALCCTVPAADGSSAGAPADPVLTPAGSVPAPDLAGDYPEAAALLRGFFAGIREALANDSFLILLQLTGVIIIVAYFLTRSRFFPEILDGHPSLRIQVLLALLFGALSIYGTLSGIEVEGSYINVRDLGPMVAGLLAGPYVGVAAGLIGAAYRITLGGFTVCACSLAAVLAGLFGGLIWLWRKRTFCGVTIAVLFAIVMELLHMALILALSRPFDEALRVVWAVALPMILANTAGVFIFAFMVENFRNEQKMQEQRDELLRERERRDTELAIAAEIQRDFLPTELPGTGGFSLAARSIPAKEVGGDFYDVIPPSGLAGNMPKTAVLIADVSGKGMPAALFMALSQTVVRVLATSRGSPVDLMSAANAIVSSRSRSGMFVTLFYGLLSPDPPSLSFINAGHNAPLLFRAGSGAAEELHATGPALGMSGTARYREYNVPLAAGDTLVLYTDGITEAVNAGKEEFGTDRLAETVRQNLSRTPQEIVDAVVAGVTTFAGEEPQADDITILVIRVARQTGNKPSPVLPGKE